MNRPMLVNERLASGLWRLNGTTNAHLHALVGRTYSLMDFKKSYHNHLVGFDSTDEGYDFHTTKVMEVRTIDGEVCVFTKNSVYRFTQVSDTK